MAPLFAIIALLEVNITLPQSIIYCAYCNNLTNTVSWQNYVARSIQTLQTFMAKMVHHNYNVFTFTVLLSSCSSK